MTNLPVSGDFEVTAEYGEVNKKLWATYHKGTDFISSDKIVYSPCYGKVAVRSYDKDGWGYYVSIHDGKGNHHVLCHLNGNLIQCKVGQTVTPETVIGIMGNSGNVTGVHVHYQLMIAGQDVDTSFHIGTHLERGKYNSKDFEITEGFKMNYTDIDQMAKGAIPAIEDLSEVGILTGFPDGSFKPKDPITREDLARVIDRTIHYLINLKDGIY